MMKINLTQGQEAIIDDWWYDYLMQWKWHAHWNNDTKSFYAARSEGRKKIYMHREVAQTPEGMYCDHVHHNTLDNRESELRNVTVSQSNMNVKLRKDNKLGVKGVYKRKNQELYRATLDFQKTTVLDRNFSTFEEAVRARKKAEEKYFGKFGYKDKK